MFTLRVVGNGWDPPHPPTPMSKCTTNSTAAIPAPPLPVSQTLVDAANSNGNSNVLMVPAGVLPSDVLAGRCVLTWRVRSGRR